MDIKFEQIRAFGPSILKVKMPDKLVDTLNQYVDQVIICLLYTSPSPRDAQLSRMPSSA